MTRGGGAAILGGGARPFSAGAQPFSAVERPSWVAATGRPSAAVVAERCGLLAVEALPHARLMVAGLAEVQAAIEVSEPSRRRA